ncbi:MAG TPA: winged helix-turn-helix domain-containing protein [Micromonosporaceae bacterium]|nr:winged helix-turn-helix domain-containing protein [Micromonosporaceae bacterium]
MRSEAPPLLPIFRSQHQADLLTVLLLHPDRDYTVAELARALDVPLSTLHREAQRLIEAELIVTRVVGRARLLRANTDNRLIGPLTQLLIVTFGPHTVIGDEFADIDGVESLVIYGSWAARYLGEPGPPPRDVDVLVIGWPDRSEVFEAAERAQERLGLPVNPKIFSPERWTEGRDALARQIRSAPIVPLRAA